MASGYPNDIFDGREVPRLVVTQDYVLNGTHQGGIEVESGHFELQGVHQGSLNLHPGASATILGTQQGSVHIAPGVQVKVSGAIEGSVSVMLDAVVLVEAGGKLAGSLHNDGLVIIRGVFGGSRSGTGELRFEDQGYIKQPRIEDGVYYYDWSS